MVHRTSPSARARAARVAGAALAAAALTASVALPASAAPVAGTRVTGTQLTGTDTTSDPGSGTVTLTVDAAKLAELCDVRLPQMLERADDAITRIQADARTKGSAAWVRARADEAAAAGRDDLARRLEFRADQRLGHVDEIQGLISRLELVDQNICSQVAP